jgi:hypothetical protein
MAGCGVSVAATDRIARTIPAPAMDDGRPRKRRWHIVPGYPLISLVIYLAALWGLAAAVIAILLLI